MKSGKSILKKVIHSSELSVVSLPKVPLIEIVGNYRLLIENHCGVTAYGENEIVIQVKQGSVTVLGMQLMIAQMSKERIIITGIIDGVRVSERRRP